MRPLAAALALLLLCSGALPASDRTLLGVGRLFTNDALGDGADRWRTGSYVLSLLSGAPRPGGAPSELGALVEYRLRAEAIGPANTVNPAPGDRRYAGLLSVGAHSHARIRGIDLSLGGDLVLVGPMTGIGELHDRLHRLAGQAPPDVSAQLPDAAYPTATVEVGRAIGLGDTVELRPFVEAAAGVESLVRVGTDLRIGGALANGLMLRDPVTGQRYSGRPGSTEPGLGLVLGADTARVFDSYLLPGNDGYVLTDRRTRLRAGLHWRGAAAAAFYGVTWLGEEFTAQPDGQAVGSLQLHLRF